MEQQNKRFVEQRHEEKRAQLLQTLKQNALSAEGDRAIKQAAYNVLKEGFKDPVVCQLKYMELIG